MSHFSNAKVGDIVAVLNGNQISKSTIVRVTMSQFQTEGGWRFIRANGRKVGGGPYCTTYAEPWNARHDEILREYHKQRQYAQRCAQLSAINWRQADQKKVEAAYAALAALGLLKGTEIRASVLELLDKG